MQRRETTHSAEPVIQCVELLVAEHCPAEFVRVLNHGPVFPGVHDEERNVAITEVIIMLPMIGSVVVALGVVQCECVICVGKWWSRLVGLPCVVVDDLRVARQLHILTNIFVHTSWSS